MKKLMKLSGYILATVFFLLGVQYSAFAAGNDTPNPSSLSAIQVIGGLAVLLLVILIPLMRKSNRVSSDGRHEYIKGK